MPAASAAVRDQRDVLGLIAVLGRRHRRGLRLPADHYNRRSGSENKCELLVHHPLLMANRKRPPLNTLSWRSLNATGFTKEFNEEWHQLVEDYCAFASSGYALIRAVLST